MKTMTDSDKVIKGIEQCTIDYCSKEFETQCEDCPYYTAGITLEECRKELRDDFHAMLKEQEEQVMSWTKQIADNQLAHAPDEMDRENWEYKKGIWDGLQIAWNIISEGR